MGQVAFVYGSSRYDIVRNALSLVAEEVREALRGRSEILIKPNFVSNSRQLAATHVDAVRAYLDFIRDFYRGSILIAEGSGFGHTRRGFRHYGYLHLEQHYGVRLIDLNREAETVEIEILDNNFRPFPIHLNRRMVEAECIISIAPMKTHNEVVATLSIKNVLMCTPIRGKNTLELLGSWMLPRIFKNYRAAVHQGYPAINVNLRTLMDYVYPDFAIVDGFKAMEGNGPCSGDPVDMRVACVSKDALACDVLAAHLMGFDLNQIGYLYYAHRDHLGEGDLSRIEVVGDEPARYRRPFRGHDCLQAQLQWHLESLENIEVRKSGCTTMRSCD